MRIAFGGDCCVVGDALTTPRSDFIDVPSYRTADARVVNLEQCISDRPAISGKTTIHAPSSSRDAVLALDATCVSLANNHMHDCGADGIRDTIANLDAWGIDHVGAGGTDIDAARAYELCSDTLLLAYCQHGAHYLRNVRCADGDEPGVNGYSLERVLADLDSLPEGRQAVVAIHWAAEYVPLPPCEIVIWAKRILEHPRCTLIVGHHPHISLGKVEHCGKEAYLSLGNLMFPEYFLDARQSTCLPEPGDAYATAPMLLHVSHLTKITWGRRNRQGIVVTYDTDLRSVVDVTFTEQENGAPVTRPMQGRRRRGAERRFLLLTGVCAWPTPVYRLAAAVCMTGVYAVRKLRRAAFYSLRVNHKEVYR